uniref:Uncharacterized protein n=1 Tax=Callorhinchus milii TaxID=7868 RepID=V9L2S2_CALMI
MEQEIIQDALDRFCSSHEQTYDEFLESFLYLNKGNLKRQKAVPPEIGGEAEDDDDSPPQRKESVDSVLNIQKLNICKHVEEFIIDEGLKVGSFQEGDLSLAGRIKVDNYMEFEGEDCEEEVINLRDTGLDLLPGETEVEIPIDYSHSICKDTSLDFSTKPNSEEFSNETCDQVQTDEVQPFSLDEDFDYDCVSLKPKYTEAELETICTLSNQPSNSTKCNSIN